MSSLEIEVVAVPGHQPCYKWSVNVAGYTKSDGNEYLTEDYAVKAAVGYLFTELDTMQDRIRDLENR